MQTPHAYVAWGFTVRTLVQVAILVRLHDAGKIVIDNAAFRASIVHLAGLEAMCVQHSSELLEGANCRAFGDHQLKYLVQVLGGSVRDVCLCDEYQSRTVNKTSPSVGGSGSSPEGGRMGSCGVIVSWHNVSQLSSSSLSSSSLSSSSSDASSSSESSE